MTRTDTQVSGCFDILLLYIDAMLPKPTQPFHPQPLQSRRDHPTPTEWNWDVRFVQIHAFIQGLIIGSVWRKKYYCPKWKGLLVVSTWKVQLEKTKPAPGGWSVGLEVAFAGYWVQGRCRNWLDVCLDNCQASYLTSLGHCLVWGWHSLALTGALIVMVCF